MEMTESTIMIDASPQTVWSVLDDLAAYPEWNPIIPHLKGRTTLGEVVSGELVIPHMPPAPPLTPVITRLVAGRELRWLSTVPGDQGFSAEHIFILQPTASGTKLIHREVFEGPAASFLAEPIKHLIHPAYESFNAALKARAESAAVQDIAIHPKISSHESASDHATLRCQCETDAVEVEIDAPISHNHLCGCSKCWKPEGALFAQTAVAPRDAVRITVNGHKLAPVDPGASINRHSCSGCGTHMMGSVDDPLHHFYGLVFVHPERAVAGNASKPEFAGFVSSIIETGASASKMEAVNKALKSAGIPPFDAFSPEIMEIISYHKRKIATTTSSQGKTA